MVSAVSTYWYFDQPDHITAGVLDRPLNMESKATATDGCQTRQSMDAFLAEVERRAFLMARYSLRNEDDALDVVQDAMIKLVSKYADRPQAEWKPLFYRILKNRIVDLQRRSNVRQRFMAWLPTNPEAPDPVEEAPGRPVEQPDRQLELSASMATLQQAVSSLPARQQQAFMLRALEGMSVRQASQAMGCSEGSVKTHYSRAVHSLRATLGEHWS
jgi:RNA polymerase sigma-70 factor (ECF subfamily)